MLIELTNQIIDIEINKIKSIKKQRACWAEGCMIEYVSIEYKTGGEYRVVCNSKEEVEKNYNIIVAYLRGEDINGCEFCGGKKSINLKGLHIDISNNKLDFYYEACACGSFEDTLSISYCPMCGKKLEV